MILFVVTNCERINPRAEFYVIAYGREQCKRALLQYLHDHHEHFMVKGRPDDWTVEPVAKSAVGSLLARVIAIDGLPTP